MEALLSALWTRIATEVPSAEANGRFKAEVPYLYQATGKKSWKAHLIEVDRFLYMLE